MWRKLRIRTWRFWMAGDGLSADTGRVFALSAFVGAFTGFVTVAFYYIIELCQDVLMVGLGGHQPMLQSGSPAVNVTDPGIWTSWRRWLMVAMPALGAMVGALLIKWFSPGTHARGTDSAIYVFHRLKCRMSKRIIPTKAVASALVIGSGGSAGYEGPMTLIGAACGTNLAKMFHVDAEMRRRLTAAGLAAGIGALFRAPLAGALFAAEIFYSGMDLEYEALLPSFIASAVSYSIFSCFYGWEALFSMPPFAYDNGMRLLPYILLAIAVAIGAKFYIRTFRSMEAGFKRFQLHTWQKVIIGGLCTGVIGFFFPDVLGTSYGIIRDAFDPSMAEKITDPFRIASFFLILFVLKTFATGFTVGSGGSGGVFGPALVCGASISAAAGFAFSSIFPESFGIHPASFALVGMAGFLAATIRTPITAIIMVAELSGNHSLLLPTMWVCGIAFWLTDGWTLYRSQVHDREASPLHSSR